ncbi:MAG TPA: ABC transporter ATP-binding protein [Egibacteraceae bacterium]|nr:ABC transporter ATP-binding protein [Actinomycetota bacterium]HWB73210.1 ABC transporter ATP-binding protein [Egibacteraceae bacterium]
MAVVVEVRGLKKHYHGGDVAAVDGVDVATGEGEYLVLLGPSGCGKTTLLRTIAGLEEPTAGEVLIGGNVVNGLPPRARQIAMVFQSYALYPHKTVLDNITFPLKAEKIERDQRRRKAQWAAELLGIAHLLQRKPRHLSGGERQRAALARALVREPSVFLLDEPLSNLDAKLRTAARDELKQFQQRIGTTTIYVTHDQVEAMGLGDRIAVLHEGRIRQLGPPAAVYEDPADTFVATFLGSPPMNLLERDDRLLGFRPENFLPVGVAGDGNRVTMAFHVHRIEYLSGDRHLYGTATGLASESRVIARLPATVDTPIRADRTYEFAVAERDLRFFDPASGRRTEPVPVRS